MRKPSIVVLLSVFVFLELGATTAQKMPTNQSKVIPADLASGPLPTQQGATEKMHLKITASTTADAFKDLETGQLRSVIGKIDLPTGASEEERVGKLLQGIMPTLQGGTEHTEAIADLRLSRSASSPSGTHYTYQQFYKDLPVWGGQLTVHDVRGGKAAQINNETKKFLEDVSDNVFGEEGAAVQAALKAIHYEVRSQEEPEAQKGFLDVAGKPIATWRVRFRTTTPGGAWEVYVEGSTLKPISARSVAVYQSVGVHSPNPIVTLKDNSLAFPVSDNEAARIDGAKVQVQLLELSGGGKLDGRFASTSLTTSFPRLDLSHGTVSNLTRRDPQFREVMAYYWITNSALYLESIGFKGLFSTPLRVAVDGTTDDNSFYSAGTLTFGSGEVPDAEDAEVILHEFGHAIQDAQVPDVVVNGGPAVRAIGEGFGDYWAESMFADQTPSAWTTFFDKWDGIVIHAAQGQDPPYLRRLDLQKHFPEDISGEAHTDGQIWSACLWVLRAALGRTKSDTIIVDSTYYLTTKSSFADAARNIVVSDQKLYGGADVQNITSIFASRGILPH